MRVVAGTVGNDEHSVGLREIIDIKHGGIEKYGVEVHYLGTSVPPESWWAPPSSSRRTACWPPPSSATTTSITRTSR